MLILALSLQEKRRLAQDSLVVTVMSNHGLHLALAEHKLHAEIAPVGDRYVLEAMLQGGYSLGGEQSGHVILRDLATTGDGLLTGLLLASRVKQLGVPLAELAALMQRLPQVLLNLPCSNALQIMQDPLFSAAEQEVSQHLQGKGRVLIRPSGTEPLLRIMVEAPALADAEAAAQKLYTIALKLAQ